MLQLVSCNVIKISFTKFGTESGLALHEILAGIIITRLHGTTTKLSMGLCIFTFNFISSLATLLFGMPSLHVFMLLFSLYRYRYGV